jgi:hypothetical protein
MRKETDPLGMESCKKQFLSTEMMGNIDFFHRSEVGSFWWKIQINLFQKVNVKGVKDNTLENQTKDEF